MATVKVLTLEHQLKKDGTIPVLIRITENRKSIYERTGYYVKPGQFKGGKIVRHPEANIINAAIEKEVAAIMRNKAVIELSGGIVDADTLAGRKIPQNYSFLTAADALLVTYEARGNVAAFNRLKTNIGYLKEAWGGDVLLSALTKQHAEAYANYRFGKGNTASTVKKNLADLAVVLNNIEHEGRNVFSDYAKTIKAQPVQRDRLSPTEIKALEEVPLKGLYDLARDMFLFSFYCHGMRFESVATFEPGMISEGVIYYRMNKGKKLREIEIHDKLQAIINKYTPGKYLFPVIKKEFTDWTKKEVIGSANTLMNTHLKRVGIIAGIEKHIHFHMARHTFASIALKKGVGYSVLKDALGHSKYTTTQGYLDSLSDDHINAAVRRVFDDH